MTTKTIFQAIFTLLCVGVGLFALSLFPPNVSHAEQPAKAPGFTIAQPAPVVAEAADGDSTDVPPPVADAPPPASVPISTTTIDMDWLVNKQNAIASVLFRLLTFLSKWIPGLNKIGDTGKRALVVGITVIVGFVVAKFVQQDFHWGDFLSLVITYLLTSLGYDKGLKPAGVKTPKVATT